MFNTNTFTGSDGVLMISDAQNFDAETFTSYFGEGGVVGRVQAVTLHVSVNVRPFYEMGANAPKELRSGNIAISGTVERAFINGALLRLMLGQYVDGEETEAFPMPLFNMKIMLDNLQPPGNEGNSILTAYGVAFSSWQFNLPEEDFVLEHLTFRARRITTEDTEVSA